MSRITFALRFKTVAGVPPLTYLLNWRMRLAERALREEDSGAAPLEGCRWWLLPRVDRGVIIWGSFPSRDLDAAARRY
jgi:AraC-like DNA-binding protein